MCSKPWRKSIMWLPLVSETSGFPWQENACSVPWEVQQFPHGMSVISKIKEKSGELNKLVVEEQGIPKNWLEEYFTECIACAI